MPSWYDTKLRTPTELNLVAPGMYCVVASGLNCARVPSACSHAAMARTFSDVCGRLSDERKSRAHCSREPPPDDDTALVAVVEEVAVVACAPSSAAWKSVEPVPVAVEVVVAATLVAGA